MNELVQIIMQKTGLSQEMAEKVVNVVAGYIESRLPAPMAAALTNYLGGNANAATADGAAPAGGGMMEQAESMLGGFFKKEGA